MSGEMLEPLQNVNEVNERNEKDKNILDEEYQTTLSWVAYKV